jgi:hypothetical protein
MAMCTWHIPREPSLRIFAPLARWYWGISRDEPCAGSSSTPAGFGYLLASLFLNLPGLISCLKRLWGSPYRAFCLNPSRDPFGSIAPLPFIPLPLNRSFRISQTIPDSSFEALLINPSSALAKGISFHQKPLLS